MSLKYSSVRHDSDCAQQTYRNVRSYRLTPDQVEGACSGLEDRLIRAAVAASARTFKLVRCRTGAERIDYILVRCSENGLPTLDITTCEIAFEERVDDAWGSDHYACSPT